MWITFLNLMLPFPSNWLAVWSTVYCDRRMFSPRLQNISNIPTYLGLNNRQILSGRGHMVKGSFPYPFIFKSLSRMRYLPQVQVGVVALISQSSLHRA